LNGGGIGGGERGTESKDGDRDEGGVEGKKGDGTKEWRKGT